MKMMMMMMIDDDDDDGDDDDDDDDDDVFQDDCQVPEKETTENFWRSHLWGLPKKTRVPVLNIMEWENKLLSKKMIDNTKYKYKNLKT